MKGQPEGWTQSAGLSTTSMGRGGLPKRVVPPLRRAVFNAGRETALCADRGIAPVKICIVSDSHDRADPLLAALRAARAEGAEAAIHCGDVIGTQTLRPLLELGLALHVVHGNNLGDQLSMARLAARSQGRLQYHGGDADLTIGGRRIYVTHYPHQARGMACTGNFDLVCCGHSHEAVIEQQDHIKGGKAWLINPGTVAGVGGPASWILGDLDRMQFELRE